MARAVACATVFVAAFGILSAMFNSAAQAAFPGGNGKIVFSYSPPGSRDDIYAVNPDGTGQVNLTQTPNHSEYSPAWSPDGMRIAYQENFEIWVMNADGSGRTKLTNPPEEGAGDRSPSWAPSGDRIVFSRSDQIPCTEPDPDDCYLGDDAERRIYTVNVATREVVRLTDPPGQAVQDDGDPAWSPDGSKIVFDRGPNGGLYSIAPDGSGLRLITASLGFPEKPSWSPDGTRFAVSAVSTASNGQFALHVVNAANGVATKITTDHGFPRSVSHGAAWSPDGTRIAYSHVGFPPGPQPPQFSIHTVTPQGSQDSALTALQGNNEVGDWQPLPLGARSIAGALTYQASPGKQNQITLTYAGTKLLLTDTGQAITAGTGCDQINANTVSCAPAITASIRTGDKNDTLVNITNNLITTVVAGPGDDSIGGGGLVNKLVGCADNDRLFGGAGVDVLVDADDALGCPDDNSNDYMEGGGANDVMLGGGGVDTVDYTGRSTGVTVDTDGIADDGNAQDDNGYGQRDNVSSDVEIVYGSNTGDDTLTDYGGNSILFGQGGSDHLYGGDHADWLLGGDGVDYLYGEDGDADVVIGGNHADTLSGGAGADTLDSRDPIPGGWVFWGDSVDCGPNQPGAPDTARINTSVYADSVTGCETILP